MSIAAAILGSGLISGAASIFGAKAGAGAQQAGLNKSIALQKKILGVQLSLAKPYLQVGAKAARKERQGLGELLKPVDLSPLNLTQENLEKTPGYQFTLGQGEKSVVSGLAARGLAGNSGALVKGAETFAAGLADKTFQERWQNALDRIKLSFQQKGFRADILQHLLDTGTNAATGSTGALGSTGTGIAQSLANIGQSRAGADVSVGASIGDIAGSLRDAYGAKQTGVYSKPVAATPSA